MSEYLPHIPDRWKGWQTVGEYNALGAAAAGIPKDLHGAAVVEIGCGTGISTRVICDALEGSGNPARVTAIDNLRIPDGRVEECTDGQFRDQLEAVRHVTAPHGKRLDLWISTSAEALARWQDDPHPIALLHVDGHHKVSYVREDLRWADFVTQNGLLVMHDIGKSVTPDWGPTGAFVEWFVHRRNWRQVVQAQSLLVMQRVK